MKRTIILTALVLSIFYFNTISFADETTASQPNWTILMLRHKLQALQMQAENAAPGDDTGIQAIDIIGTYKGTVSGMKPNGDCIVPAVPVTLKIDKQCQNFAKGSITAFGVTVPVTGLFKNNLLSLDGVRLGTPIWLAGLNAQYVSGRFVVGYFDFYKANSTLNNRYNDGWILKK